MPHDNAGRGAVICGLCLAVVVSVCWLGVFLAQGPDGSTGRDWTVRAFFLLVPVLCAACPLTVRGSAYRTVSVGCAVLLWVFVALTAVITVGLSYLPAAVAVTVAVVRQIGRGTSTGHRRYAAS